GYVEASDVDFETDSTPEITLGKFRLDLSDYVGTVPTTIGVSTTKLDVPVELFNEGDVDAMLKDLGYDHIVIDSGVSVKWHEADKTVSIDNFKIDLADMGSLTGSAVLGGLARSDILNVKTLGEALANLNLVSSKLTIADKSFLSRWIAQQAYDVGV